MSADRVGPPTARNEPWRGPVEAPAAAAPGQYAARDAAWEAWAANGLCIANEHELRFARAVFCAGWEARKRAVFTMSKDGASR